MSIDVANPGTNALALAHAVSALVPAPARSRKMVFVGSSITSRALSFVSPTFIETSVGYATWVKVLTNQRFYSPPSYNLGIFGYNTSQVLSLQMPGAIALNPDIIVSDGGITNSVANGISYAQTISDLEAMWDAAQAIGAIFVQIPLMGRGSPNALTSTQLLMGANVNRYIIQRSYARKNLFVANCGLAFDDPAAASWTFQSGFSDDGLHSNNNGAQPIGQAVANILDSIYPNDFYFGCTNASDVYDPTNNPYGNMFSKGMLQGTGGTITGGLATGSVADGWSVASTSLGGATCVLSKSTFPNGAPAQQIDLSGTYTGNSKFVQPLIALTAANFAANDIVDASAMVSLSNPQNVLDVTLSLQSTEGGTTYAHRSLYGGTQPKTAGWSGVLKIPPRTMLATPSAIFVILQVSFMTPQASTPSIGGTIKFGLVDVRKNLPTP